MSPRGGGCTARRELHGLYTWAPGQRPRIQVWMRTAKRGRVVAFRTEGFFQRESSLFGQLVPPSAGLERREAADTGKWSTSTRRGRR
ncbi:MULTISPECIES: hypothetical protein [unclassified Corallococcus]|nr:MULTISPECIES: hypothetical protein [unclassified Corallococcus]